MKGYNMKRLEISLLDLITHDSNEEFIKSLLKDRDFDLDKEIFYRTDPMSGNRIYIQMDWEDLK
jgi:hypothetical protein